MDSSSEENDRPEHVRDDTGISRSYECTFCKRGFTNAQALGGHMNIHRKDRAKNKQHKQPPSSSVSWKPIDDYGLYKCSAPRSSELPNYYAAVEAQGSYHIYLPPSAASARQPVGRSQPLISKNKEFLGTNLSLRIGPTMEEYRVKDHGKEDEVDLELRLGHDP